MPDTVSPEVNEINPKSLVSTSRPIEINELSRDKGHQTYELGRNIGRSDLIPLIEVTFEDACHLPRIGSR